MHGSIIFLDSSEIFGLENIFKMLLEMPGSVSVESLFFSENARKREYPNALQTVHVNI